MEDEVSKLALNFRSLDDSIKIALSEAAVSPMRVGLATLVLAYNYEGKTHLSASQISLLLEEAGVAITPTQITKAFARAGGHITRTIKNGEVLFRAMTSAHGLVRPIVHSGPIQVVRIEAGKPRSARQQLGDLLSQLNGTIRICDPYFGLRTLDALALIPNTNKVQFLTSRTFEKSAKLSGPLSDFKKENSNVELRVLSPPTTLHDRYILAQDTLLLLGHGIKDIGSKESFVIVISSSFAGDLFTTQKSIFDHHWANASHLTTP